MEVFDYGGAPEEESAILRIYRNSAGKSFNLEYSDRFSAVDEGTKERAGRKMSARGRKNKITGGTGETWVIRDVDEDLMTLDYDNGKKDGEVWRKYRFVFKKVGDTVVRA